MNGNLEGRTEIGSREYQLSNGCFATRMSNYKWMIFDENKRDLGLDYFETLKACREWAKSNRPKKRP